MTRKRKLLSASLILMLGFVLAWPFRKSAGEFENSYSPIDKPVKTLRASNGDPIAGIENATSKDMPVAPDQVAARMASAHDVKETERSQRGLESFDLANHPALVAPTDGVTLPTPSTVGASHQNPAQPAYATAGSMTPEQPDNSWPAELVHIVANGDTLEKLAERYLHDSARALEIFDLNRDQLSNPHLLPIGVELRVPADPDRILD